MIAEFLRAEWDSSAFAWRVRGPIASRNLPESIVLDPDITNTTENAERETVLRDARGWPDAFLFAEFPRAVEWSASTIERGLLSGLRHVASDGWLQLTGGTRLPEQSAESIRLAPVEEHPRIWAIVDRVRKGEALPRMIMVSDRTGTAPVVLEGNARLVALVLAGDAAPEDIEVIHGRADSLAGWKHA